MRESRTYGSVRGALSNERPYRDRGHGASVEHAARAGRNPSAVTRASRLPAGFAAHTGIGRAATAVIAPLYPPYDVTTTRVLHSAGGLCLLSP